jgi:hypothetical protein
VAGLRLAAGLSRLGRERLDAQSCLPVLARGSSDAELNREYERKIVGSRLFSFFSGCGPGSVTARSGARGDGSARGTSSVTVSWFVSAFQVAGASSCIGEPGARSSDLSADAATTGARDGYGPSERLGYRSLANAKARMCQIHKLHQLTVGYRLVRTQEHPLLAIHVCYAIERSGKIGSADSSVAKGKAQIALDGGEERLSGCGCGLAVDMAGRRQWRPSRGERQP